MVDLKHLRTFLEVTRTKSLTVVGRNLNLTQPAISLHIKKLEESLAVRLLVRRDRKFELTEFGVLLHPIAVGVMNLCNKAKSDIQQRRSVKRSTLSIGSSVFFAEHYLPRMLKMFREKCPEVQIRCFTGPTRLIEERVNAFECDVAFIGQTSNPNLVRKTVAEDELVLIVTPTHPLSGRQSVTLHEIAKWPLISFSDGSGTQALIDSTFARHSLRFDKSLIFSSTEGVKRAVESGCGVALFPAKPVQAELDEKTLVAIPLSGDKIKRVYSFVFRKDIPPSPVVKIFRQIVLNAHQK